MKREYDEQVNIIEDAIKRGENQGKITLDDIKSLEKELLNLKLKGADLRKVMTHVDAGKSSAVAHNERRFQTPSSYGRRIMNSAKKRLRSFLPWFLLEIEKVRLVN